MKFGEREGSFLLCGNEYIKYGFENAIPHVFEKTLLFVTNNWVFVTNNRVFRLFHFFCNPQGHRTNVSDFALPPMAWRPLYCLSIFYRPSPRAIRTLIARTMGDGRWSGPWTQWVGWQVRVHRTSPVPWPNACSLDCCIAHRTFHRASRVLSPTTRHIPKPQFSFALSMVTSNRLPHRVLFRPCTNVSDFALSPMARRPLYCKSIFHRPPGR